MRRYVSQKLVAIPAAPVFVIFAPAALIHLAVSPSRIVYTGGLKGEHIGPN